MNSLKYKKIGVGLLIFIMTLPFVYIFFWPYDFKISLDTSQSPLSFFSLFSDNVDNIIFTNDQITFDQRFCSTRLSGILLNWKITGMKNQKAKVEVTVEFLENRIQERFNILFQKSESIDLIVELVKKTQKFFLDESIKYRWGKAKSGKLVQSTCICVNIESSISDKANQMNQYVDELAYYVEDIVRSYPRNYIKHIDFKEQRIKFDFCFPLKNKNLKNPIPDYFFVSTKSEIKGKYINFYGNYSLTHLGWFYLIDRFANMGEEENILITEVFYDSPFSLEDDKNWNSKLFIH